MDASPATPTLLEPAGSTARHWTASQDKRLLDFIAANPGRRGADYWQRAQIYVGRDCSAKKVRLRFTSLCRRGVPRAVAAPVGRPEGSGKITPQVILAELRHATRGQVARKYGVTRRAIDYVVLEHGDRPLPKPSAIEEADIALAKAAWEAFEKSQGKE